MRALAAALEQVLGAVRARRRRPRRRSAGRDAGRRLGAQLGEVLARRWRARRRSARSARRGGRRAPRPRCRSRRRSRRAPVACAAARALISAFSANVSPVSGGELDLVGQRRRARRRAAAARTRAACGRCGWRARAASAALYADGGGLRPRAAPRCPCCGEREQLVEVGARERRALGGRLDLDEAAVAGHDDVRVDLGGRVLGVVEVEQRHAVDDAARDRGDACR